MTGECDLDPATALDNVVLRHDAPALEDRHTDGSSSSYRSEIFANVVQTDAPISSGNSGGALVGGDGRVIGINVAYIPPLASAVAIGFATLADVRRRSSKSSFATALSRTPRRPAQPLTLQVSRALGVR